MARIQEPRSEGNDRISDILHRADAHLRMESEGSTQPDASGHLTSTIQRVSGASLTEIDRLISELQSLRDYLLNEGHRIEQEIAEDTRLNQGAMESTRLITERLLRWRTGSDRGPRMGNRG
jgi:hypothetical protein